MVVASETVVGPAVRHPGGEAPCVALDASDLALLDPDGGLNLTDCQEDGRVQ